MDYLILKKLSEKLYFTVGELADILGVKPESARVLCSRYAKNGLFVRLKNNFYITEQSWTRFSREDFLKVSNFLQVPSYISFMTALSFYEMTTQVPRNFCDSASLKRSAKYDSAGAIFNYYKLKSQYYFDFVKQGDFFIATKEKAFIDAIYLYSFGKYKLDISSLDLEKLDKNKIRATIKKYPEKTQSIVEKICKI